MSGVYSAMSVIEESTFYNISVFISFQEKRTDKTSSKSKHGKIVHENLIMLEVFGIGRL